MARDRDISKELLETCACTRVRTAARLMTRAYDNALRPVGLKASQLAVLAAVASVEAASIVALSKVLCMDRTTLSRNLTPLVTEKLVTLVEEGGGRSKTARITSDGQARLHAAVPLWRKAQRAVTAQAGERRLNELNTHLSYLIGTY